MLGRIVTLEPGTFENGSVYQHAVCFYIYALLKAGKANEAFDAMVKLLPTNPENFEGKETVIANFYNEWLAPLNWELPEIKKLAAA